MNQARPLCRPQPALPEGGTRRNRRWQYVAAGLIATAYLLQLASPLRLNADAIVFLSLGASVADGEGPLFHGSPTHYPAGYPYVIATLDRLQLARSSTLIAVNLLALATGLASIFVVGRLSLATPFAAAFAAASLLALNWLTIKTVTLPISDTVYLGLSLLALAMIAVLEVEHGRRRVLWITGALGVTALAIFVRTVGIALVPALVWAILMPSANRHVPSAECDRPQRPARIWHIAFLLATGLLVSYFVTGTLYFQKMLTRFDSTNLALHAFRRLGDFGELACNVPRSRLPESLEAVTSPLLFLIGCAVLLATGWLLFERRKQWRGVDVYLGGYLVIVLVWPWPTSRFLLPIVPLIFLYSAGWLASARSGGAAARAMSAYLLLYCALGAAALAYSTRISWAGQEFPELYAGGKLAAAYRDRETSTKTTSDDTLRDASQIVRRYHGREFWTAP